MDWRNALRHGWDLQHAGDGGIFLSLSAPLVHIYPTTGFVHKAKLHGAHTVELNIEPSQVGSEFEEKQYDLAIDVVPAYVDKLLKRL